MVSSLLQENKPMNQQWLLTRYTRHFERETIDSLTQAGKIDQPLTTGMCRYDMEIDNLAQESQELVPTYSDKFITTRSIPLYTRLKDRAFEFSWPAAFPLTFQMENLVTQREPKLTCIHIGFSSNQFSSPPEETEPLPEYIYNPLLYYNLVQ
jgi:hypothetical protein